jgi:predicted nucleic acid-binding protein
MLLDTSGLLCCFDADENRHSSAAAFYDGAPIRITHNYVLAEFVALCQARGLPRTAALEFATAIAEDPQVDLVWIDATIHEAAMQLLRSQLDKSYSLCDAVSFIVMQQRNITAALTTDHHFAQAGFERLLPR